MELQADFFKSSSCLADCGKVSIVGHYKGPQICLQVSKGKDDRETFLSFLLSMIQAMHGFFFFLPPMQYDLGCDSQG